MKTKSKDLSLINNLHFYGKDVTAFLIGTEEYHIISDKIELSISICTLTYFFILEKQIDIFHTIVRNLRVKLCKN